MKNLTTIVLMLLLCNSIIYGQSLSLQDVMNNGNYTKDAYRHKNTINTGKYILVDTPYVFTTDYYTPKFVLSYHSDSAINATTPTGSPSPQNAEGDHVWDLGININGNSGVNDTAHASIGIQWESLYWGGLSSVIPAQEFHLFQTYKDNLGSNRFLTYAGLEDGSNSQLNFNAAKINVGGPNTIVNICSEGNNSGGMSVLGGSVNLYATLISNSGATFANEININGTNVNAGGQLTITSGSATNYGRAVINLLSNGTNSPATITVSATGANDAAGINVSSATSAANFSVTGTSAIGDFTSADSSHKIEIGANSGLAYLASAKSLNLYAAAAQAVNISSGDSLKDLIISASHNVLIANADSIGGNLSVTGNTYVHTAPSSSLSDSLLGKNSSGQIVSIATIAQLQNGSDSVTANAIASLQQQAAAIDSANANIIAILQQQITDLQSQVQQLQTTCSINCGAATNSHLLDNVPNPFTTSTDIRYYLADDTSIAYIIVTNISGSIIKEYNITGSTNGSVTFDAGQLSDAIYMYSLMVNGQIIDTKKMALVR